MSTCIQQEVDEAVSRIEDEYSRAKLDELPFVGPLEPNYMYARRNAEAERGAAVFHGNLSYALILRAELFKALHEGDIGDLEADGSSKECRAALVKLAAWTHAAIEAIDRRSGR